MYHLGNFPYYIDDQKGKLDNESDNEEECPPLRGKDCEVMIYGARRAMKFAGSGRPNKNVRLNGKCFNRVTFALGSAKESSSISTVKSHCCLV